MGQIGFTAKTAMAIITSLMAGAWTWFNDPRALSVNSRLTVGGVNANGDIVVGDTHGQAILAAALEIDDHDNPALLIRASDQRVMAFYSKHIADEIFMQVSTNPLDITSWSPAVNLDVQLAANHYTYANAVQLTGEANTPIYLFLRAEIGPYDGCRILSKSIDGGATWSRAIPIFVHPATRPYMKLVQNGNNRIDFLVTDGHPDQLATSIYHCYYTGGAYFKSDGTLITNDPANNPIDPAISCTRIWDGTTAAGNSWTWQIAIGLDGAPVCVYAVFPAANNHRYRGARWTGLTWDDHEIAAGGAFLFAAEQYYSGGICIDPDNVSIVYYSRQVSGVSQIFKNTSSDNWKTWGAEVQVTFGANSSFRPFLVPGYRKLLYCNGPYTSFTNLTGLNINSLLPDNQWEILV